MVHHCLVSDKKEVNRLRFIPGKRTKKIIGKNPERKLLEQKKLVINDEKLQDSHVSITTYSTTCLIRRLTSRGFVKVNKKIVTVGTAARNGDRVQVGENQFVYLVINNFKSYLKLLKNKNYNPVAVRL